MAEERESLWPRSFFISMNALHEHARGHTRFDVAVVRHLYLDFDEHGTQAIEQLLARENMPEPNYLVNTSPSHWQVSWKVQGFSADQAGEVMRAMVREFGADPAATDVSRVLRVPGFLNHKRGGHMVRMEQRSTLTYSPDHFPRFEHEDRRTDRGGIRPDSGRRLPRGPLSQSELDWAYAKRALAHGESPDSYRIHRRVPRSDKADPEYYAQLEVRKAVQDLGNGLPREPSSLDR